MVERFRRVCPRHGSEVAWREAGEDEDAGFPAQRAWCSAGGGHTCPTWGVLDVVRGQLVAVATRRRVTLLAGWPAERAAAS